MKHVQKIAPFAAMAAGAVLALATSAFKQAPQTKGGDPTYSFEYNAPIVNNQPDYSVGSVENVANWKYNESATTCSGSDEACTLLNVPATYVNAGSTPTLKTTIDIDAVESSPGVAKVNSTAASSATISNQTD